MDTRSTDWDSRIARTVGEAVEADLARLSAIGLPSAGLPVGGPAAGDPPGPPTGAAAHGRVLLTALGTALGNGYSREEWLAVASYDARQRGLLPSDGDYAGADLEGLMDTLGRYVIQDVFRGPDEGPRPAVYRIAHQSAARYRSTRRLWPPPMRSWASPGRSSTPAVRWPRLRTC
ncbi:hypothetical protein [Streptomyces goshikiensis]|uniref:hypothetical protein n=1 Tax=Streptomyces goshikiensis TaxID=1942 RepID=UPI0036C7852B